MISSVRVLSLLLAVVSAQDFSTSRTFSCAISTITLRAGEPAYEVSFAHGTASFRSSLPYHLSFPTSFVA